MSTNTIPTFTIGGTGTPTTLCPRCERAVIVNGLGQCPICHRPVITMPFEVAKNIVWDENLRRVLEWNKQGAILPEAPKGLKGVRGTRYIIDQEPGEYVAYSESLNGTRYVVARAKTHAEALIATGKAVQAVFEEHCAD